MSGFVQHDQALADILVPRWRSQASQMRTATGHLGGASIGGLPAAAHSAARRFLRNWEDAARRASVAADVYADDIGATSASYASFDAEIARRMARLGAESR